MNESEKRIVRRCGDLPHPLWDGLVFMGGESEIVARVMEAVQENKTVRVCESN